MLHDPSQAASNVNTSKKRARILPGPEISNSECHRIALEQISRRHAEKLLPHPQDFTAFGFLNVKPRRDRSV